MAEQRAIGAVRRAPVVLAFDTTASACSVAVGRAAEVLGYERQEMRHGHAEALLPMIDRVTTGAMLTPRDIETIAVSVGPGGFTGIRAGLAAAQGLALAARARVVGITSFAAVAARLPATAATLVALDSRRDDVYVQLFAGTGHPAGDPAAVLPEALAAWIAEAIGDGPLQVAGDVAESAAAALGDRWNVAVVPGSAPDALGVLAATRRAVPGPARPLYIRPPDVTLPKARR